MYTVENHTVCRGVSSQTLEVFVVLQKSKSTFSETILNFFYESLSVKAFENVAYFQSMPGLSYDYELGNINELSLHIHHSFIKWSMERYRTIVYFFFQALFPSTRF